MALDLLRTMLAEHIRRGEEIPRPKPYRGARCHLISLPVLEAAKVELYRVFRASGMRKSELARSLVSSKTTWTGCLRFPANRGST